ncbi:S1C family serine protease [Pseudorhodoferax sp.]|uniref:S1C family serine protease n=1 Tax=Pseudorhodoferax sp. TaxID=1993553 RepID=UPI002DD6AC9E|nr:S1C family serine protease [Pseudorhodoferax sp.]
MRTTRLATLLLALGMALASGPPSAQAATPAPVQQTIDALSRANAAVVGVQVVANEDAASAETLGRQRQGSGVVIGPDGLILTIGYLMLEAEHIQIVTQEGRQLPAQAVAYDLATGFGLVRPLLPLRVAPVPLGSHPELEPGTLLMTATGGEGGDVAMVHLVGKRAFSGYWEYFIDTALFTSPPVANHSGAPLFNQKGELIGIGSLFVTDALGAGRQLPGNMFVPVDLLKPILAEMQSTGSTRLSKRPWLGLNSVEQSGRVQVARVSKASPASAAGLQAGDVVLAVDGTKVTTLEAFYKKLWDRSDPQTEVQLTVLQGADVKTLTVKPVDRMSTMRKPKGI